MNMLFNKNFYLLIVIIIILIYSALIFVIYRKCSNPGAKELIFLLLAALGYAVPYTLQMTSPDLKTALFWYNLSLPGANLIAPAWLLFSLSWKSHGKMAARNNKLIFKVGLVLVPFLVCVASWTNLMHNLYGTNFQFDPQNLVPVLKWDFGLFYWLGNIYAYGLFTIGTLILLINAYKNLRLFFHQSMLLITGTLIPVILNIAFLAGFTPIQDLDIAPYAFLITGIIWTLAVYLFKFMDIVPVAHKLVFKQMQTGMLILDNQMRVVDINPAALKLLELSILEVIGRPLPAQFAVCLRKNFGENLTSKQDKKICLSKSGKSQFLDVQLTPFLDDNNENIGYLLLFNDVSEQKQAENALRESENKFRNLYEHSPIGIMLFDAQGHFLDANRTAINIFHLSDSKQLIEDNLFDQYHLNEFLKSQLLEGKIVNYETSFEYKHTDQETELTKKKSGKICINTLITPLLDNSKQIEKFMLQLQDVSEYKQMEKTLSYQSTHDALTELYNRQFFENEMLRLENNEEYPISILAIDMNGLKTVNDTLGHAAGDELLVQTAQVIKSAFRADDIIARIGGDEFVILLPKTNLAKAEQAVIRLNKRIFEYNQNYSDQPISLSIGTASTEKNNNRISDVLRQADLAMYRQKREIYLKTQTKIQGEVSV